MAFKPYDELTPTGKFKHQSKGSIGAVKACPKAKYGSF